MPLYRFAGLTVEMSPTYPTLQARTAPYRIPDDTARPDFSISIPRFFYDEMLRENPARTPNLLEYVYTGALFDRYLLRFGGMTLHSSAVVYDGRAYLFSAPAGTGKSTHTAGWLDALGARAYILNDDKPALRRIDGGIFACGTPFSGSSPLSKNAIVPLGGICMLSRGADNDIHRLAPDAAIPLLYEQTAKVLHRADGERMLALLCQIAEQIPIYALRCTVGRAAVQCAFEAMTGQALPDSTNESF